MSDTLRLHEFEVQSSQYKQCTYPDVLSISPVLGMCGIFLSGCLLVIILQLAVCGLFIAGDGSLLNRGVRFNCERK